MIIIEYNGITYKVNPKTAITLLIEDTSLIKLPMKQWEVLLEAKSLHKQMPRYLQILEAKIKDYDTSSEVNSFLIGENKFWLDKATRVGLMHLANCSTDNLLLVLGDLVLTIPVDIAKDFLAKLEVYAGLCYLQTQKHLLAIKSLKTVEDVINYDYTKGYPEKITFNV